MTVREMQDSCELRLLGQPQEKPSSQVCSIGSTAREQMRPPQSLSLPLSLRSEESGWHVPMIGAPVTRGSQRH